MRAYLQSSYPMLGLMLSWMVLGIVLPPLGYAWMALSILALAKRERYFELLVGFWFILILSDNLKAPMEFARTFKNIYILLLTAIFFVNRRKFAPFNTLYKPFIWFYIIGFIALAQSPILSLGVQKTISHALLILVIPQYVVKSFRDLGPQIFSYLVYTALLLFVLSYCYKYVDLDFVFLNGARFRGVMGNPNGMGLIAMLLSILFLIARNVFPGLFSIRETYAILAILAVLLILSGSRTAIMGFVIFTAVIGIFKRSVFLGVLLFMFLAFIAEIVADNIVGILVALNLEEYFRLDTLEGGSGRIVAWNFAWENVQDYILLGRGFAYDEFLMEKNQFLLNNLGHQGGVHNSYLSIWLNTGVLGLIFFIRALVLGFIQGSRKHPIAVPALVLILFVTFFESWLMGSLNPFTITMLFGLCLLYEPEIMPQTAVSNSSGENHPVETLSASSQHVLPV